MKRVLFVDDEYESLEALKGMLERQALPWEAAFVTGGKSALDLLAEKSFDVIISDIRMPEMDGAALLKIACERFPGVVRIVVCSQEEMNGALRAVPVAHQFLLKPCEPHMLRVAVERATSLSDVLGNKLLANIVGSVKDLPVLPRTFMALREKLADPERVRERGSEARGAGYFDFREDSSAREFGIFRIAARDFHAEYRRELFRNRHAPESRAVGRGVPGF